MKRNDTLNIKEEKIVYTYIYMICRYECELKIIGYDLCVQAKRGLSKYIMMKRINWQNENATFDP